MKSGKELLRLLKANGFEVASVTGSHYKLLDQAGHTVTVPYCNTQYPKKTYHDILKQAGLRHGPSKQIVGGKR